MKSYLCILFCLFLIIFCICPGDGSAGIIFVDKAATGSQTGTSWPNAFKRLQDGLDAAGTGDEIWVAKGKYLPTVEHGGSGDEYKSFQMKNNVAIYGGFNPAAGDILFNDRDWVLNETVLCGDLGWTDWDGDDALHVFYHPAALALDMSAVLDGFTICHGHARGSGFDCEGGGMYNQSASPTIRNCLFIFNKAQNGGGMANGFYSCPVVSHTRFVKNTAKYDGGGMYNQTDSNSKVHACSFVENQVTETYSDGGGMRNHDCEPVVTNTLFLDNRAGYGGGAMNSPTMDVTKSPVFINCNFFGNMAAIEGGGIYNYVLPTRIANCIFRENIHESIAEFGGSPPDVKATFSNIQMPDNSVFPGLGNINAKPLFQNAPGFIDITTAADTSKAITVADASRYKVGDNIEIENDGVLRKVLSAMGNEVAIKPYLPAASGPGMQIKNWKSAVNISEDFHLQSISPCVDKGSNLIIGIPFDDFEYEDRIIDGDGNSTRTADMGVDEFNPDAVIYVDHEADGANNGFGWNNAYTDLQDALDRAVAGDRIWVAAGTYIPSKRMDASDARSAAFQLKNNVILYGGFDPSTGDRDFTDRDVTLNPTILSGEIGDPSSFYDNCYHVFFHPPSLGLNRTAVLDGFFIIRGYAFDGGIVDIKQRGGGIYNSGGSPTIQYCHFRDNRAGYGGGIYNETGTPDINNCTFSNNTVGNDGGGIYLINATLSLTSCSFGSESLEGNTAFLGAGLYIAAGSDVTATDCLIQDNSGFNGGGIYCDHATLTLSRSNILYNNCKESATGAGSGAGIYMSHAVVTFNDLSISHNFAYHQGGGLYGLHAVPSLHNVLISHNRAQNGAGLYFDSCSGVVDGTSSIEDNALYNDENGGGAYLCNGSTTEFNSIWISSNSADDTDSFGGGIFCDNASPVFTGCRIIDNKAGNSGGGAAIVNGSTPDFHNCSIDDNEGGFNGGGIYIQGSDPVFSNCSVSFNQATHGYLASGGGMACFGSSPRMTDCALEGNQSTATGGGMLVDGDSGPAAPVLTRCTFKNNRVSSTISDFASGGGMYIGSYGSPVLESCMFETNQALGSHSDSGGGGAYSFRSGASLTDCTFTGNYAKKNGGAFYSLGPGPVRITRTDFSENQAATGGAYYGIEDDPGSFFRFCRFDTNSATNGGAVYLYSSENKIVNSVFQNNTAISGGGIMLSHESVPVQITGSLFSNNLATSGGALFFRQANPYVQNCTLVANRVADVPFAVCGGIYNEDASPIVSNSIIYGNESTEIEIQGTSNPVVTWSDIQGGYGTAVDHNLNTNPRLDADFKLMAISPLIDAGSNSLVPADITDVDNDMDTAEALPLDVFQEPRLVDDPARLPNGSETVDMGADEFEAISGCFFDEDEDNDVDGKDLSFFISAPVGDISAIAGEFGNHNCQGGL